MQSLEARSETNTGPCVVNTEPGEAAHPDGEEYQPVCGWVLGREGRGGAIFMKKLFWKIQALFSF